MAGFIIKTQPRHYSFKSKKAGKEPASLNSGLKQGLLAGFDLLQ
jgi:hypothetical protein